jgi:hypothetical protein
VAFSGGGGQGANDPGEAGGSGGSGVVIISHPSGAALATVTGNVVVNAAANNVIYTFTDSGTITF